MADKKASPADLLGRGRGVLSLAARVAGQEIRHRARAAFGNEERASASEKSTRIAQAMAMVESLGRMKGALMKAGQLLSMDAGEWLPKEALEVLGKLQGESEPMAFEVMRQVIVEDLGTQSEALLAGLDEAPAAAASMGQVYRGMLDVPVAVKVQYPGIADSIDSDIEALATLSRGLLTLSRKPIDMEGLFRELADVLHHEANYERERGYLERFRFAVANDTRFIVPESLPQFSSRRVLTMTWQEGVPLGAWIKNEPSRDDVTRVSRDLLELYCLEFFSWGMVQTDPNFGNFLIREDGRIVLLDFGATVEYEPEFRAQYMSLLRAVEKGDRAKILEEGIAFQLVDPREAKESLEAFVDMLVCSAEPFAPSVQPFRFRDSDYNQRSREIVTRFIKGLVYSPPPKRLIFLHRKLGGLFQLLKRLDVELDLSPYWAKMTH